MELIDEEMVERMSPAMMLQYFLMCSFLYYIHNESVMADTAFDLLCSRLDGFHDDLVHQHKYLVTRDMLSMGSGFNLDLKQYPFMVRCASYRLLRRWEAGTLVPELRIILKMK